MTAAPFFPFFAAPVGAGVVEGAAEAVAGDGAGAAAGVGFVSTTVSLSGAGVSAANSDILMQSRQEISLFDYNDLKP
jgi:hypothetical protein